MLSIIMPVKNTSRYLHACLDSIVHQTLTDWELVAIDDHSNDNSRQILNSYATNDGRIRVITNKGDGVTSALQTGYDNAVGNFITRMDSDDINEWHKYEYMLTQLQQYGEGHIALGQVKYFCEDGLGVGFQNYERWINTLIANGRCFEDVYKECVIPSPCWMMYRTDFDNTGGFNTLLYPEDYDLCFRMYRQKLIPIPCPEVLFHWRDYQTRTTRVQIQYQSDAMLQLKCHHFLNIDHDPHKNLIIWGAGKRGKLIARTLNTKKIHFTLACNNPNKIGHQIYGSKTIDETRLYAIQNKQIIVTVANIDEQKAIREICQNQHWEAYFFC